MPTLPPVTRPRIAPTTARQLDKVAREYAPDLGDLTPSEQTALTTAVRDALNGVELVWTHNREADRATQTLESGRFRSGTDARDMLTDSGSIDPHEDSRRIVFAKAQFLPAGTPLATAAVTRPRGQYDEPELGDTGYGDVTFALRPEAIERATLFATKAYKDDVHFRSMRPAPADRLVDVIAQAASQEMGAHLPWDKAPQGLFGSPPPPPDLDRAVLHGPRQAAADALRSYLLIGHPWIEAHVRDLTVDDVAHVRTEGVQYAGKDAARRAALTHVRELAAERGIPVSSQSHGPQPASVTDV